MTSTFSCDAKRLLHPFARPPFARPPFARPSLARPRFGRALAAAVLTSALMSAGLSAGTAGAAGAADAPTFGVTNPTQALPNSFAPLAERVAPAVVTISATRAAAPETSSRAPNSPFPPGFHFPPGSPFEDFFRRFGPPGEDGGPNPAPEGRQGTTLGSGFLIDPSGDVVTNNHVVEDAKEITVTLDDGTRLPATVVGRDAKTDLALLKVKSDKPLPALAFGDSDKARVGDWVVAVGNPFGLGGTVTTGVVSARGRDIGSGPYDDFIQTDAAINRGNSGGPMFNLNGEVIGINTAIYSPSGGSVGIGFAIPSNIAKKVVAELKASGHVERGWLGVRVQAVTPEIAESLGLERDQGALVADVTKDSPAAKAGVRQGDVVVAFAGKPIVHLRDLPRVVAQTPAGSEVAMTVRRQGAERTITVQIAQMPEERKTASAEEEKTGGETVAGLALAPLDRATRERLGLDEQVQGVVVTAVSAKDEAISLRPGDVIVKVADARVTSPAEVARGVAEAEKAGRKAVLLLINRQGAESFVALALRKT